MLNTQKIINNILSMKRNKRLKQDTFRINYYVEHPPREYASMLGFDPRKTVVHGTKLVTARKIQDSMMLTNGTFMYPARGGLIDAATWSENIYKDNAVVIFVEIDKLLYNGYGNWITLGKRAEERKGIDTTMKKLKVKKIRIFKILNEGLLEEIY